MAEHFTKTASRAVDGSLSRLVQGLLTISPSVAVDWSAAVAGWRVVREATLEMVRDLTQTQADFKPAPDVWSIAQNLDHLLLSENLYRRQIQRLIAMAREGKTSTLELSLAEVNSSFAFIPRDVMPLFTAPMHLFNAFLPSAVREVFLRYPIMPALHPLVSDPAVTRPVAELRAALEASVTATEKVFQQELPPNLEVMQMRHPLLGTNTVVQILTLIGAHEERHHIQMKKVLSNPAFPA